ncbi:hypothetical protein NEOLI_003283, partial [Neolecta irregularis DAH-3]
MEYSESPYLLHGFRNLPFIALILDEQLTIRHSSCLAEDRLHLGENHIGVHLQSYICAPINLSHILDGLNATSSCTLSLNLWNAEVKATFSKWTSEWTSGFNVVMEDNHSVVAQETLTKFEFLEAVLEHIGSAVFAVTADGRHALYNRQAGDCFGNMLPPPGAQNTEWVYKRWTARNPQTNEEVRLPLEQILSTGAHLKDVDVLITNNEEVGSKAVHSVVNGRPIDHNGKMVGAILLGLGYPEWRKVPRRRTVGFLIQSNLRRYGKPDLPMSVKLQMMGRLGPAAAQVLIDWAELPLTPAEYFAEQSTIQTPMWPKIQILPGVLQLIIHLSEKKIPIAIATSSTTANYRLKLNHLEILTSKFDAIVTGDCDLMKGRRGKPKGDIFLLALEMLGLEDVRPNECLVFEDSVPGVEAAKD